MKYRHFEVAMYFTTFDMWSIWEQAIDNESISMDYLSELCDWLDKHIHVSKIYIESYRNGYHVPDDLLKSLKEFFIARGYKVSGGVTLNEEEGNGFNTLCYSDISTLDMLYELLKRTVSIFDEVILDDFFFDNCKCAKCIEQKGDLPWSEFRMKRLTEVSEKIMKIANETNPEADMIIKYPNWYESYQELGYNTETTSQIFTYSYTGTEIRDTKFTQQTLQPYGSYFLMRYIENIDPNYNKGGWFDAIDCEGNVARFLDQLYLTLLAGAKEVTLFSLGSHTIWDKMFTPLAGYGFERMDALLEEIKTEQHRPNGIATYKPFHSSGENYLHQLFGMVGLPLECYPDFPDEAPVVLLTKSAAKDDKLTEKMKKYLLNGGRIVITSGLLERLNDEQDMKQILNLEVAGKSVAVDMMASEYNVAGFRNYSALSKTMNIPIVDYHTNDIWLEVAALAGDKNYPILLKTDYGDGELMVLTVPDNMSDLKKYPSDILTRIRQLIIEDHGLYLEGPGDVALVNVSDSHIALISFLSHHQTVKLHLPEHKKLVDIETKQEINAQEIEMRPRSMRVIQML